MSTVAVFDCSIRKRVASPAWSWFFDTTVNASFIVKRACRIGYRVHRLSTSHHLGLSLALRLEIGDDVGECRFGLIDRRDSLAKPNAHDAAIAARFGSEIGADGIDRNDLDFMYWTPSTQDATQIVRELEIQGLVYKAVLTMCEKNGKCDL